MSRKRKAAATVAFAAATALLAGCAYVETRADGSQRIIGLVYLETGGESQQAAGRHSRVRTLGLSLAASQRSFMTTVGYSDSALTLVNENSCVALTAPTTDTGEGDKQ